MKKALSVLALCFALASCAEVAQKQEAAIGNMVDMGNFTIPCPDGFVVKHITDLEKEISGSFSVALVFKPLAGLAQGDIDSIAPLIEGIRSSAGKKLAVEHIEIDGVSAVYVEAEHESSPYIGLFVPLEGGVAEVYTKQLPSPDKKSEAVRIIKGFKLKRETSLNGVHLHLLEPMSRN